MSDMLNEKFAEFVSEQNIVLAEGDPMPTVTAAVLPANPAAPGGGISGEPNRATGGKDPAPSVGTNAVSYAQQSVTDNGGPRPDGNDEGEDNPGAKAASPVGAKAAQSDGTAQTANIHDAGDQGKTPSIGVEVAYGTSKGPDVSYPIKPSFESVDVSDDVNALFEGTELTEEFKEKATTIFEAAIKAKLSEEYDKLVEHFANELEKQVESAKAEISEEVNGTVNYAIGQWMEENQVSIDRGIRNEITEDFIAGLKNLFEEHYISIPDEKVDVVEGMAETIREMEERLNEQVKANVKLQNRLNESKRQIAIKNIAEGLVDTQKDKLAALAEGLEFTTEEEFSKKLKTIRESYFPNSPVVREETEETPVESEVQSPAMSAYLQALSRWSN